ncbi:ATPase [Marinitoga sp. 1135]|uniref:KAP family P-loop NTPase fold protein n=1 Tax=unclassified Marinitoga TaxID=2640159 RepID=UPI0009509ED4|nr:MULTISPECIES: ATP-binding protein [unclassified Marinitoga]APT76135.1 ATPase [Marinitoga sp. 1137]NUU95889.1 ATPase [Marinitoga sp. 1135]NUU97799.1 ATPase [Marinitoga sp. 1138]
MDNDKLKYIISSLFDVPISNKDLLVDREKELKHLNNLAYFQPMGIFGVCGETGVGKTTVLNFIETADSTKFNILITEKDSKEVIIADFLYKLSKLSLSLKNKNIEKIALEAKDFILTEKSFNSNYSGGINAFASATYEKGLSNKKRFNIYTIKEYIEKLLELLIREYGKILIVIDELDKEKKDEVLNILDSLKNILLKENVITIVSLPFSIYREYSNDRMRWNESGNLENIFKDMIFLDPLTKEDIKKLILKRIKDYPDYFHINALEEIASFSDGNPRDALWIAQQIALYNTDKKKIDETTAKETIKSIFLRTFSKTKSFTEIQKIILKEIIKENIDRTSLVKKLQKKNIKRQTIYTYITRWKNEGLILENDDGILSLPAKVKYYVENL